MNILDCIGQVIQSLDHLSQIPVPVLISSAVVVGLDERERCPIEITYSLVGSPRSM